MPASSGSAASSTTRCARPNSRWSLGLTSPPCACARRLQAGPAASKAAPPAPGPTPPSTGSSETRDRILAATAATLRARGYAKTHLSKIAERASVQAPAIYHYFRSKDDILLEIRQRMIDANVPVVPGTAQALTACLPFLPEGATFAATGVGRTSLPVMLAALSAGGHLRVGMEDTLTYAPGEPVRDNAQLVARAAGLARIAQRPPMSTDDARSLLGIKPMEALK